MKKNIIDLFNREIQIVQSRNETQNNMKGRVIDETRNTIVIKDKNSKLKTLPKKTISKLMVHIDNENVCFINGISLIGRAEDKISNLVIKNNG